MNKRFSYTGLFIVMMGVSLMGFAGSDCLPIKLTCMKAGYYKGGQTVGKDLVKDCMMRVIAKKLKLKNTEFSDTILQLCHAELMTE